VNLKPAEVLGLSSRRRYSQVLMRLTEQLHPLFTHFIALAQGQIWHRPDIRAAAATATGIGGEPDAPERHLGGRGDSRF